MGDRVHNVLFLCTGNSARSILAEALLAHWGGSCFGAFSAGSMPRDEIHPFARDLLRPFHSPAAATRPKSWHEFAAPDAPAMSFIFTLCDELAALPSPRWPGRPLVAHWSIPDPVSVQGKEAISRQAFRDAYAGLERRIRLFTGLPLDKLDRIALKPRLDALGDAVADRTAA